MQSSNPVLTRYEKADKSGFAYDEGVNAYTQASTSGAGAADVNTAFQQVTAGGGARLTINDVVVKGLLVFAITVVFAVVGWNTIETMPWLMWVGMIGGLALGFVNALKKVPSPPLIMLYAALQGVFLGGISNWYDAYGAGNGNQGIVLQAVLATMTTFGVMLTLYLTGVIKVTKKFQSIMIVALVSYMLLGLASLVAALFGVGGGWGFYGVSGIGLGLWGAVGLHWGWNLAGTLASQAWPGPTLDATGGRLISAAVHLAVFAILAGWSLRTGDRRR